MTISCPSACAASTRHAHTSVPSRSTEHEPHSPCSQAFFEPGRPIRSRSAKRRLSPSQTSASMRSPLTVTSILTPGTAPAPARVRTFNACRRYAAVPRTSSIGDAAAATCSGNDSRSSSGAVTRPVTGPDEPYDARSSPRSRSAESASEHTAITIAFRGPIFMNVCEAPDGESHTAVISSSGSSVFRFGPTRNSPSGTRRTPRTLASSTSASSITSGGSASPAGEAVPRLPPIVPRLRICGEPTVRDASASAGRSRASSVCITSV